MTVEFCQKCNSPKVFYNEEFDFWTCETCGEHWSDGKNDPDYDEDSAEAYEAIADQNIELIHQWRPQE
jgi:ribosomal protein L37AE/L43A